MVQKQGELYRDNGVVQNFFDEKAKSTRDGARCKKGINNERLAFVSGVAFFL